VESPAEPNLTEKKEHINNYQTESIYNTSHQRFINNQKIFIKQVKIVGGNCKIFDDKSIPERLGCSDDGIYLPSFKMTLQLLGAVRRISCLRQVMKSTRIAVGKMKFTY
jgi:hypothetical protein